MFSMSRFGWVALTALVGGCAGTAELARRVTYPPDFEYIGADQMKTAMARLAVSANGLNRELRAGPADDEARERVVALLVSMKAISVELHTPSTLSNHPLLDHKLAGFEQDLAMAIDNARANPPNYYLAGTVVGSCLHCHDRPR